VYINALHSNIISSGVLTATFPMNLA